MDEILFSIIIPHYNIPQCLNKLLESIPNVPGIEVIVVDDKSDFELDKLNDCIRRYDGPDRHFYSNDTNKKGAGICRNIGVEHAKGRWLLFADSDDMFSENMYSVVSSYADSDADVVFFKPTSIDLNTGKLSDRHLDFCSAIDNYINDASEYNELVLRYQVVSPWSKIIRRQMVIDYNIKYEDTRVANDVLFCRKIGYFAHKIDADSRVIYVVSDRSGSLTKQINKEAFYIRLNVFVKSTDFVRKNAGRSVLKKINFNGSYFLHMCRINKLGFFSMLKTSFILVKNGIRPF